MVSKTPVINEVFLRGGRPAYGFLSKMPLKFPYEARIGGRFYSQGIKHPMLRGTAQIFLLRGGLTPPDVRPAEHYSA